MIIRITPETLLSEIQNEFSSYFTFLKLEFFSQPHVAGKGTKKEYMQSTSLAVKDINKKCNSGSVSINDDTVVSELEKQFKTDFGLNVQVFRKSGKIWLETTATDNWTLAYQNSQGQELSKDNLSSYKQDPDS